MEKYSILICDDSKLVRIKLKRILQDIKFENYEIDFLEAADGQESVNCYRENKPDLMFLDIVMPQKSGVEVVKEVMELDPDANIIMASSVGTKEHLREALKYGARDFIQKPLNKQKIKKVIVKILSE